MKITFVSNYINHHQIPMADAIYEKIGKDYCFIQTMPMEEERIAMGWGAALGDCPYLVLYSENKEYCDKLILESDIVIFGGVDDETYIQPRLKQKKIVLRYCERMYKDGVWKAVSPRGLVKKYHDHTRYRKTPVFLLCAGGYVAYDYSIVKAYPNKKFKWGYFPAVKEYDSNELSEKKQSMCAEILWAGRMIDWKHPETVIEVAKRLKRENLAFHITMIGGGDLYSDIEKEILKADLTKEISLVGFKNPEEVREYMENSNIYLFTSDFREGWGAVLNEAMNSGCAVVANHGIGAVPFLLEDRENGMIYRNGDMEECYQAVKELLQNPKLCQKLGRNAYETIKQEWNPIEAAKRLLTLCENLIGLSQTSPTEMDKLFQTTGPLSKAEIIPERKMYRKLKRK